MPSDQDVAELPPSAKLVYTVLDHEDELTQQGIAEHTRLAPRTVRHALSELESIDAVERTVNFADARQHIYRLSAAKPATTG